MFARDQRVGEVVGERPHRVYDGLSISPDELAGILQGQTLFAAMDIAVIRDLSENKPAWELLMTMLERGIENDVIVTETKLDKRTKAYKTLQKHADVTVCDYWTDRQRPQAERWLAGYAKQQGIAIERALVRDMVERAIRPSSVSDNAIIDQQRLATAIKQLCHAETIDRQAVDTVLAPSVHENVFDLLATALDGQVDAVREKIHHLRVDQDGHRMMGLLSSQLANLTALVLATDIPTETVARDIAAHPFALKQLEKYRVRLSKSQVANMVEILADADARLKQSQADVWVLIEKALVQIALENKTSCR